MAQLDIKIPETPNIEWQDAQFPFDGAWLPDQDPSLIGPRNFSILTNLRYNDKSIEGVNGYTKFNTTTAIPTYTYIDNGYQLRTGRTTNSFILVHAINPGSGQGRVYQNTTTPGSQGDFDTSANFDTAGNSYFEDASVNLKGRFSSAPQSSIVYCNGEESLIYSGFEHRIAAAFIQKDDSTADIKDISEKMSSSLQTTYTAFPDGSFDELIILTTRPIQGIKFYVKTANAIAGTMTVTYWDGSNWTAVTNESDGTTVAGKTLAQTGFYTFDHTVSVAELKHYQELYLYAYKVTVSAGVSADVYSITCDPAFQPVQNVWDGVYRQPIQFQIFSADHFEDYTLQVNQSSDINVPIGAILDGLLSTDYIYIMFEEQMSAIKFTMLGGLVNKAASVITLQYWDGDSFANVANQTDGTLNAAATKSFNQSGLLSWTPATDEQKRTLFGSLGYVYKVTLSGTLTGTKGGEEEVLVDLCAGIPKLDAVGAYDFSVMYKNRLMLGGLTASGEGNRMDFSSPNAPDVFNGTESSDGGLNSLYFGGDEPLRGAVQLFNRFGASVYSMLVVFKDTETYLLVGDSVEDFEIFPVSTVVGCPAPGTITTTELSPEGTENLARNFALWLSHAGPLMFDGAIIAPLKGIENYFDPNLSDYINWTYAYKSKAWIDPNYKEWNLIIPTGGDTTPKTWLVYDLYRKKWYKKDTGSASTPICGFNVMNPNTGEQSAYGGLSNGRVVRLEDGTSWDGTGITQTVKTGDFWPSNNIWDLTLLRKFKLVAEKITSASSYSLEISYYKDTEQSAGQSVSFEDADVSSGIAVSFADTYTQVGGYDSDALVTATEAVVFENAITTSVSLTLDVGLARVVRKTIDLNYLGFCHAFKYEVTTDDVQGGFKPVVWGVQYRIERKDNTAS